MLPDPSGDAAVTGRTLTGHVVGQVQIDTILTRVRVRERSLVVRRFRVQTLTGDVHTCLLPGEPNGDDLRPGDIVHVAGRRNRRGHVLVRRVEVLAGLSGPVISTILPRRSRRLTAAMWRDRATTILALVLLGWPIATATGLGG